ncbi:CRTAC1 family protein [Mariniflexile aquimaris]|uniref:CRTAC1 family protein n=1 Tax=Mariniflexile aquimaris TaxID=881009 RepID=A0ABW3BT36_9FLAO
MSRYFLIIWSFGVFAQSNSETLFFENPSVIQFEDRSRRKFDNAVIADLDQDGYLDLLLTEHSRRVELYWNNKGTFVKGEPFIFGDTHGIAVADYNQDGNLDVIVQPGGGNGEKPSKPISFQVKPDRTISGGDAFAHFEGSRGRAAKLVDVDNDGVLDLITTAFPPNNLLSHAHFLYKNEGALSFKFIDYLPHADRFGMRSTITDFNNDGISDILFYGCNNMIVAKSEGNFSFTDVSKEVLGALSKTNQVNSISEIDFDNDGDMDLFLTRSREPFGYESDYDKATKAFYFFARMKPFLYDNLKIEGDFIMENLQMAFPDFDVFIGSKKHLWQRKEDKHGHHDVKITPEEAQGWPEDTTKRGLYIGYLGNGLWRVAGETNSPTSAVIHNVVSKPEVIALEDMPAKLLENRGGVFFDVTAEFGIDIQEQTSSSAVGDFNNDGWSDIFVLRYGNPSKQTKQILLLNQGGKKFIRSESHGIITKELGAVGMGADAFDYDKDGDLDIICANERGKWHLFTNNSNSSNNYIQVNVGNSPSGKASAMGAVLTVAACNNTSKRVVGATSSPYSHSFNTYLHVGLGTCEQIENAFVTWSNGEKMNLKITTLNKIYHTEN